MSGVKVIVNSTLSQADIPASVGLILISIIVGESHSFSSRQELLKIIIPANKIVIKKIIFLKIPIQNYNKIKPN